MNSIFISKQKMIDRKHNTYAYELIFKNDSDEIQSLSSNVRDTSKLIMSSISSTELNKLLGKKALAFINVNEEVLSKGILDVLDKDRFILNILEDINLSEKVISKIVQYRKRGFRLSLEHFDSSATMIKKFSRLFNYIDIIKMDIALSEPSNLEKVMKKFQDTRVKLLAQNIENKKDMHRYFEMGFDYFQGYYIDKPEVIEVINSKEPNQFVILQLIKIIKDNKTTDEIESFIKLQADLSFKLVQFFNNYKSMDVPIESLTQVITLMGRDNLLRWLMVYLYSELSKDTASKTILDLAIKRAERMEAEANHDLKDKAYLAGMFSMLSSIFETDIKELMDYVNMDKDITMLVLEKKGVFAGSLMRAEEAEKVYLKKVMLSNFEKLSTTDLIYALEDGGIEIDKDKF
ncbi:MAG: EAL domain-containing protein [Sulfurimonas sp.]